MTTDNYEKELDTFLFEMRERLLNEKEVDKLLGEIRELILKKHNDYGSANLLKHGLYGILVRLDDKLARIMNFHKSGKLEVGNESVEDTYKDITGYGIQSILILRGIIK